MPETLKVLNLYAGVGGNRKLWDNVEVTAVELDPKIAKVYSKLYPEDEVIVDDAHQYLLENSDNFDFIWSSPPCPTHSKMMKATKHKLRKYPDMKLYEEILFLQHFFKGKWVVENVVPYYKPLIEPIVNGRHAYWANFDIGDYKEPTPKDFINLDNVQGKKNYRTGSAYTSKRSSMSEPTTVQRKCYVTVFTLTRVKPS